MGKESNLNKDKRDILIFMLVIKALYIIVNVLFLPEEWAYMDYDKDIQLRYLVYEVPIFILVIGLFLKYYHPGNSLSFVSTILICIYVIPINSTLSLCNYGWMYYISSNLYCALLVIAIGMASNKLIGIENPKAAELLWRNTLFSHVMSLMTIIVAIGTLIYVYLIQGTIDFSMMIENEMYEKRAEFAEFYMAHTNGIIAYVILIWRGIVSTLLPIGFYAALKQNRIFNIALVIVAYLALFTLSMEKSTFLTPIIVLFIFFLEKKHLLSRVCGIFVKCFTVLLGLVWINASTSEDTPFLFRIVVSRMCYMPSYLNHVYYYFFNAHSKIWFTSDFFPLDRFVRMVLPASYPNGMVKTISVHIFNETIPSPNTGLFAEAFAQMGYWGILVFPFVVPIIARIYAKIANNYGLAGALILLSGFSIALTNTAVFSTMGMVRILIFVIITWGIVLPITKKIKNPTYPKYITRSRKSI